jgi:hypothetical protein
VEEDDAIPADGIDDDATLGVGILVYCCCSKPIIGPPYHHLLLRFSTCGCLVGERASPPTQILIPTPIASRN